MTTDFSTLSHEDTVTYEATGGGDFKATPLPDGPALLRLREVIEMGVQVNNFDKIVKPVRLIFEVVHAKDGAHAITKSDGTFVRNQEITVRVNKGFNEKGKYRPLFNKMNYAGAVPTVKGEVPSMHHFLGKPFLADLVTNVADNGKSYVNIDVDGVWTIRAPVKIETDDLGTIVDTKEIPVPEMAGDQVCFLWDAGVSDEMYTAMWNTLDKGTFERDGVEHSRSFERMDIMNPELNTEWEGSRAQLMFAPDAIDDMIVDMGMGNDTDSVDAPVVEDAPAPAADVDPLAGL